MRPMLFTLQPIPRRTVSSSTSEGGSGTEALALVVADVWMSSKGPQVGFVRYTESASVPFVVPEPY